MRICITLERWLARSLRNNCRCDSRRKSWANTDRIETEDDQDYLLQDVLLKRYSIMIDGQQTQPANVIERAVDLHALRVTGASGYQKCVNYLWRGWLVQDENDPSQFVQYK